jgi:hydroxymethylpyrimidine/phosphomethylpyrimidine kinase
MPEIPYIVAIGGLDPGGGAGLVRDRLTATALGARVTLLGTAWTVQSRAGVQGVEPRPADAVGRALAEALREGADAPTGATAVKVGMVATPALVRALLEGLATFSGPVVVDPVLASSSGGRLFAGEPTELLPLLRRATLVTPNLAEAAALAGRAVATAEDAAAAGHALLAAGCRAVLVKGGHLTGPPTDLLCSGETTLELPAARVPGPSPRGTGCALATAIAVALARGSTLAESIATAKAWLATQIAAARPVGAERHLP